ncbi:hypothetical protein CIG57_27640 [Klebsiella michiganensis]|nr:hypothetical protein CIG57_27640 [Klebsiella michiganensis]
MKGGGDAKRTQQLCRFLFPRSASVEFFISSINFMFNHHLFLKYFLVFFMLIKKLNIRKMGFPTVNFTNIFMVIWLSYI